MGAPPALHAYYGRASLGERILLHLMTLFVVALVCHGELARHRPPTEHLTAFYLAMSIGGVLGGIFNALVAPVMFNDIIEYEIALVVAGLLLPQMKRLRSTCLPLNQPRWRDLNWAV